MKTKLVLWLHGIGQIILLSAIHSGGIELAKRITDIKISFVLIGILFLISVLADYNPKIKAKFSLISLTGISICFVAICYFILSNPYGQWTVESFSDFGGDKLYDTEFRQEILVCISAINFLIALSFLSPDISKKSVRNITLFFLFGLYMIMYSDFVFQKKPNSSGSDFQPINEIEECNLNKCCYYKYRFMYIKFGQRCN